MLSFKDFMVVDYTPGQPELVSYAAHKRHRGRIGEDTNEALNFTQRRARGRQMKKIKARLAHGRRKAAKKPADAARLVKRANKQARNTMFKKLAKGKSRTEIPNARKQEIEKRLDKFKPRIQKLARRILPNVRKMDKERRSGSSAGNKK